MSNREAGVNAHREINPRKKVFTTGEAAKLMNVAPRTVSKWFDEGRIRGYRIPGSNNRRIPRDALLSFLKAHGMPLGALGEAFQVLVVGASAEFLKRLREHLTPEEGYEITETVTAFEAGVVFQSLLPSLVILDLAMGRDVGIGTARALKVTCSRVKLVCMANEDEVDRPALAELFDHVFVKPFDAGYLVDLIASLK